MEKLYRVQMNKNGMPNFSTAEEAEPWDLYDTDEWCTDCKEYDAEREIGLTGY